MNRILNGKHDQLFRLLEAMEKVLVAYSGGVDSSLLLKVAFDAV
jgi:PP-loop superfamily ATP-utilizing enzyme